MLCLSRSMGKRDFTTYLRSWIRVSVKMAKGDPAQTVEKSHPRFDYL